MGVFVIAEAACTWRYGDELATAKRSIEAAKACGADAWKTQWTSDPHAMLMRRTQGAGGVVVWKEGKTVYTPPPYGRLAWDRGWINYLNEACRVAGIEFMCTVYLPQDIEVIAPFVKRFKVSAFESHWKEFLVAHGDESEVIVSVSSTRAVDDILVHTPNPSHMKFLHCVSLYPTPLDQVCIRKVNRLHGFSDHTGQHFMGGLAVIAGAKIIESHVMLYDTPKEDPDYGHSLPMDGGPYPQYKGYVENVRLAERIL